MPAAFTVAPVDYRHHAAALHAIRHAVFVQEQGIDPALERDGRDAACHHVLACGPDGEPIGTGRLSADGRIGRMAVLPDWRGQRIGSALLDALCGTAIAQGLPRVILHAQMTAIGLYQRAGFVPVGPPHMEAGLLHQSMERRLPQR